jgi:hypothetical protein
MGKNGLKRSQLEVASPDDIIQFNLKGICLCDFSAIRALEKYGSRAVGDCAGKQRHLMMGENFGACRVGDGFKVWAAFRKLKSAPAMAPSLPNIQLSRWKKRMTIK